MVEGIVIAIQVLIFGYLLKIERRLGKGDNIIDELKKWCPIVNRTANCPKGGKHELI